MTSRQFDVAMPVTAKLDPTQQMDVHEADIYDAASHHSLPTRVAPGAGGVAHPWAQAAALRQEVTRPHSVAAAALWGVRRARLLDGWATCEQRPLARARDCGWVDRRIF
jgi:hypothetical protein